MKRMAAVMSTAPGTTSTTSRIATGNSIARLLLASFFLSSTLSSGLASAHKSPADLPQHPILPPSVPLPDERQHLTRELDLQLKHVFHHGLYKYPRMHRRLDVSSDMPLWVTMDDHPEQLPAPQLRAKSAPLTIQRLADRRRESIDALLEFGRLSGQAATLSASDWTMDEIAGPNITDQETVISFARMAANAYVIKPPDAEWEEVGGGFNYTEDFGWETDGLRGHIFADTENSTVVIALKGTSPAVFDGSETTTNDKLNDNLFFSCCCGQGGQYLWKQVCDCQTGRYQCDSKCLVGALRRKNRYYYAAQDLYHNVTAIYPDATIWLAGHSLGGAVSSLLGLTVGVPSVTFEAVPEAMPAARLGLPVPPGDEIGAMHQRRKHTGGYHFGHTADPIFMGTCNTASSFCTLGGYALQSQCHAGMKCTYDTVKDFGWRVGIGTHKIHSVINDVILKYDTPPQCIQYSNCTDCYLWSYHEGNGTGTTTSTTSSKTSSTRTRTQTCKTPGWWGCLDETTTGTTTTTTTTSTSTSTCKTPGWFGCKDPVTTTTTSSTTSKHAVPAPSLTSATVTSSSSCSDPGWFGGCHDPTSQSSSATPRPTVTSPIKTSSSTTCTSKEWFGLICVDPSPAGGQSSASISSFS